MARRDEGAYVELHINAHIPAICNRGATKRATLPRRKTLRDSFQTRS